MSESDSSAADAPSLKNPQTAPRWRASDYYNPSWRVTKLVGFRPQWGPGAGSKILLQVRSCDPLGELRVAEWVGFAAYIHKLDAENLNHSFCVYFVDSPLWLNNLPPIRIRVWPLLTSAMALRSRNVKEAWIEDRYVTNPTKTFWLFHQVTIV